MKTKQEWANFWYKWNQKWPSRTQVIDFLGIDIVVPPGVFPPTFDTPFYATVVANEMKFCIDRKNFCNLIEIGCGSGAVSIYCELQGAVVTSVDINPGCIRASWINKLLHDAKISILQSDAFETMPEDRIADIIFCNIPWNALSPGPDFDESNLRLRASFDVGYQFLKRMLSQASKHLTQDGKILLGADRQASDLKLIERLARANGYSMHLRREKKVSFMNEQVNLVVFELTSNKRSEP